MHIIHNSATARVFQLPKQLKMLSLKNLIDYY